MAIAFVQSTTGVSSGATNPTVSTAFGSAVVAGDLIVVTVCDDSGVANNITSVTDTGGNTYVQLLNKNGTACLSMYYAIVKTGGASFTVSVTWNTGNTSGISFVAQEFNGFLSTPTPEYTKFAGPTSSTSPSSGASNSTNVAQALIVTGMEYASTATTVSLAGTFTNLGAVNTANHSSAQASKVVTATGAQTGQFTLALSREWICAVVTFYDGRWTSMNNEQFIKVGDGMSTTERIR